MCDIPVKLEKLYFDIDFDFHYLYHKSLMLLDPDYLFIKRGLTYDLKNVLLDFIYFRLDFVYEMS